jgi:hypothetical protein
MVVFVMIGLFMCVQATRSGYVIDNSMYVWMSRRRAEEGSHPCVGPHVRARRAACVSMLRDYPIAELTSPSSIRSKTRLFLTTRTRKRTNLHWARVVGYGPFSLCVIIHKEGLYLVVGALIGWWWWWWWRKRLDQREVRIHAHHH